MYRRRDQDTMTDTASYSQLLQEVQELHETVRLLKSAVDTRHRVTLRLVQPRPFLGQPVTIIAAVTDSDGITPRVNVQVTFAASWGILHTADGYTIRQGNIVTARTGVDGTVRITFVPPTSEKLWDAQQDALETMLGLLDEDAPTPHDTETGLKEMVRQYRWEPNIQFRQAVDIYFQTFRHRLLDTINLRNYMQQWLYVDSTVTAYVQDNEPEVGISSSVHGTAVLALRFKDWLGAWFQTHLKLSESEGMLEDAFRDVKEQNSEAGTLLDGAYRHLRDFVANQRGLAGKDVAQRVAKVSIQRFLDDEISDLSLNTRIALSPALKAASNTIAAAGVDVVAGLGQVRSDLRQEQAAKLDQLDPALGGLTGRIDGLETQLTEKLDKAELAQRLADKLDATDFNGFRVEVNGSLDTKVGNAELTEALADKLDAADFNGFRVEVNDSLNTKVGNAELTEALADKLDAADFNRFRIKVNDSLNTKVGNTRLTEAVAGKLNTNAFNSFRDEVNRSLDTKVDNTRLTEELASKLDATDFSNFQTEVSNSLSHKVNVGAFNRFSSRTNSRIKGMDTQIADVKVRVDGLDDNRIRPIDGPIIR